RPDRETYDKILATRTLWLEDASIDLRFLRQLPQLWQLVLKGGGLTAVPEVVWELSRLRELNCSRHTIEQLDPRLAQLEQLEALYLDHNQLRELPDGVPLPKLEDLRVAHNDLEALPDRLGEWQALEELWVGHNRLTQLPDSLSQLRKLQVLDFRHNKIQLDFDCLQELEALHTIGIQGNPISRRKLLRWLRERGRTEVKII
ncbi:MAG: leucine-rich repeat domain-containing protein, partial [Bacteroidota bacterium]